ncbi:MAG: hypothetical protein L6427_06900 [Actinomycetia bacterium]|nr:hypothetical protein [Actinomycetes bacterium]
MNYSNEKGEQSDSTLLHGYPFGVSTGKPPWYNLSTGLIYNLTSVFGAQASYNLLLIFSFPLAGILMFALLYYLTRNNLASFLGGFFYAFSPWHTARTFDQISLAGIHCIPLFLLALIVFWKKKSFLSAIALAAAWIIAILTDPHIGFFCLLLPVTWFLALWFKRLRSGSEHTRFSFRGSKRTLTRVILLALLIVIVTVASTLPVINSVFHKDPAVFAGGERRGIDETVALSARPWYYVVPPIHSPIWKGVTKSISGKIQRKGTNEVTCYPGIVTVFLAAFAIFYMFRRKRSKVAETEASDQDAPDLKRDRNQDIGYNSTSLMDTATYFGVITAAVAFILSMPPLVSVGGIELPTPSIIMRAIAPPFRFYSRWALLVTFALCLLASIGFARLVKARNWKGWKPAVACILLLVLFCVDTTIVPPWRSKDISKPPEIIYELRGAPHNKPVCFYPLRPGFYHVPLWDLYYQQFHLRPMLNGVKEGTEGDLYSMTLMDIYSPYNPRMLKALGIEQVVVLTEAFDEAIPGNNSFDPESMPPGYSLVNETSDGYIFDVVAEPATVFPLFYMNFTSPRYLNDVRPWTVLQRTMGEILLINKGEDSTRTFSIDYMNPGGEAALSVKLDGRYLGEVTLPNGSASLDIPDIELKGDRQVLTLEWGGEPVDFQLPIYGTLQAYLLFSRPTIE